MNFTSNKLTLHFAILLKSSRNKVIKLVPILGLHHAAYLQREINLVAGAQLCHQLGDHFANHIGDPRLLHNLFLVYLLFYYFIFVVSLFLSFLRMIFSIIHGYLIFCNFIIFEYRSGPPSLDKKVPCRNHHKIV